LDHRLVIYHTHTHARLKLVATLSCDFCLSHALSLFFMTLMFYKVVQQLYKPTIFCYMYVNCASLRLSKFSLKYYLLTYFAIAVR